MMAGKRALFSSSLPRRHAFPCVDLAPILVDASPSRKETLAAISRAMTKQGFFIAENVNLLPGDYMDSVYSLSAELHGLPTDVKRAFSKPHGPYSGADVGLEEESYEVGTSASVRSYDFSRVSFNSDGAKPRWPLLNETPHVHDFLDDLYERQDVVSRALMVAFAEMLGLPSDEFLKHFIGGDLGTIRLLHYPAASSAQEAAARSTANVGISPHTDFEFFTLMHQRQPGLQLLCRAPGMPSEETAEWVDAPVDTGTFVVVAGDIFERFTNGVVRAIPHRVLHTPHHRDAVVRFNALKPDTLVTPLQSFVTSRRPCRYSAVTMETHMKTTMGNLKKGIGAWEPGNPGRSLTATYEY